MRELLAQPCGHRGSHLHELVCDVGFPLVSVEAVAKQRVDQRTHPECRSESNANVDLLGGGHGACLEIDGGLASGGLPTRHLD
ncbi:hypothetical protein [Micromonospora arborensis]|uniref:hypothetical protein n=1 Tax=Micromonospora arborensis TaxID=2116518 RepID=UPI0011B71BDB|nr:hypothetical protein [Micromonospora arborensis]